MYGSILIFDTKNFIFQ